MLIKGAIIGFKKVNPKVKAPINTPKISIPFGV